MANEAIPLETLDVSGLEVSENACELRKDLHVLVDYVLSREVKRTYRDNSIPKADAARLAKVMTDPEAVAEVKENGASVWVDFVDHLALQLGFVQYDTKGEYAGYSSNEPSYANNYIRFGADKYRQYMALSLAEQEKRLLNTLVEDAQNEFYSHSVLGRLDPFSSWGSATGVMKHLDLLKPRRFLLDLLQACRPGVWYSTASLIAYLKAAQPFFLIPQNPKIDKWDEKGRYHNFQERRGDRYGHETKIAETLPDAFERVEGRYVERFLEGIPLTLRYVDVAYGDNAEKGLSPILHGLRAFRANERLHQALQGNIPAPKVTVVPNFEVYVESKFYPAGVMAQLLPLTEVVSEDVVTILRLQKERVAAQLVKDKNLDVAALLTRLSGRELPQNVARELAAWAAHSEKFTLYEGFALLEGDEGLPAADPFTVERVSPGIRIIRSPAALFTRLEQAELAPLRVKHDESAILLLPEQARTVFAREGQAAAKPAAKPLVGLLRKTKITLSFIFADEFLERLRKALLEARCSVEIDKTMSTLTFVKRYEPQVTAALEALQDEYQIQITDID